MEKPPSPFASSQVSRAEARPAGALTWAWWAARQYSRMFARHSMLQTIARNPGNWLLAGSPVFSKTTRKTTNPLPPPNIHHCSPFPTFMCYEFLTLELIPIGAPIVVSNKIGRVLKEAEFCRSLPKSLKP
jgi:hypothetical protein